MQPAQNIPSKLFSGASVVCPLTYSAIQFVLKTMYATSIKSSSYSFTTVAFPMGIQL